jgi:maltose alpha-D-glucosyltransferase / alpha-amylase
VTATGRDGGLGIRSTLPAVAARLPAFLPAQRWFGGKERAVARVEIRDTAIVPDHPTTLLAIVDVFTDGAGGEAGPSTYFLPLGLADPGVPELPGEIVARHGDLVVRDAVGDPDTCRALLRGMLDGGTLPTSLGGRFVFQPVHRLSASGETAVEAIELETLAVRHAGVEQSNSSVIFGTTFILKALRRLAAGTNPEIEIPRFLGEHTTFDRVPALIGWAEYRAPDGSSAPVAVLQRFVPNQGDGWSYVLRKVAALDGDSPDGDGLVSEIAELGRTLGELHLALASCNDVPDFVPVAFTHNDLDQWRQRTHASLTDILARVEHGLQDGPVGTGWSVTDRRFGEAVRDGADRLRAAIDGITALADGVTVKTRHHGDFHLGQTLVVSDGWMIIDFEGEPLRSLTERRARQTPLRDLAGLLRSLDYAHATAIRQVSVGGASESGALGDLFEKCRKALLVAYVATIRAGGAPLLPEHPEDLERVLLALEVEKALYELTYELGNRPGWVSIPMSALARLAEDRDVN